LTVPLGFATGMSHFPAIPKALPMAKKKISRKDLLKKPDEFLTFSERAVIFARDHAKTLKAVGVVLAAAVLIYLALWGYFRYTNKKGLETYNLAYYALLKGKGAEPGKEERKQAEEYFRKVMEDYGLSKARRLATAELASIRFQEGKYKEAAALYWEFLERVPEGSPYQAMARLALAACQEAEGDVQGAVETLKMILSGPDDFFKEQAYLGLARAYRLSKQEDKAREILKKYVETFTDSPFLPMAKAYLEK